MSDLIDSKVPWIGKMPSKWNIIRFKDKYKNKKEIAGNKSLNYERIALTLNGVIKRSKDDSEGLQPKDFDTYQIIEKNDFVFKMIDLQNISTSRVGLSPYTGLVSPAYLRFSPKNELENTEYMKYYLMCLYYNCVFNNLGGDGVRSSLSAKDMGQLMCPYPNDVTQDKIVTFLNTKCSQIDELIAIQEQEIEKLKAYKQSLITEVVTKGLDPNVEMKDSGVDWIGKTPSTNEVIKLKYIATISRGLFNHRPRNDPRYYDGPHPFVQTGDVARAEKYINTYSQTLNDLGASVSKKFPKGTMTMTIAANIGDVAILNFDAYFPDSVLGCSPKKGFDHNYIYYVFCSLKEEFTKCSVVSTQLNLNIDRVKNIEISVTKDILKQKLIADYLDSKCSFIDRLVKVKQLKISKLNDYRKSLIYEYTTGKKEVM